MSGIICVTSDGVLISNESHTDIYKCKHGEKYRMFIPDEYNRFRVKHVEVVYCGEWVLFDGRMFYGAELNGSWADKEY